MRNLLRTSIAALAVTIAFPAFAVENVVWWDFLSGGDGVRMKALIQRFNDGIGIRSKSRAPRSNGASPITPSCRHQLLSARDLTSPPTIFRVWPVRFQPRPCRQSIRRSLRLSA